jgi:hypothetical protein
MPDLKKARMRELIEEAIVDAYGEEEQEGGFLVMLQDNLATPFKALVVGEEVAVRAFDLGLGGRGIVAVCNRKGRKYRVSVTSLEWVAKPPKGAEWVEAYKAWLSGNW